MRLAPHAASPCVWAPIFSLVGITRIVYQTASSRTPAPLSHTDCVIPNTGAVQPVEGSRANYSRSSHPQPVAILKDVVIPSNAKNLLFAAAIALQAKADSLSPL